MKAKFAGESLERIHALSAEKLGLYNRAAERGLTDKERARLDAIKQELTEAWEAREQERIFLKDPLNILIENQYKKAA